WQRALGEHPAEAKAGVGLLDGQLGQRRLAEVDVEERVEVAPAGLLEGVLDILGGDEPAGAALVAAGNADALGVGDAAEAVEEGVVAEEEAEGVEDPRALEVDVAVGA